MASMDETDDKKFILEKASSGVPGFENITHGGLPRGRPTLVCGDAGSGKTLFGMQFLVAGATEQEEPGVFVAFKETESESLIWVFRFYSPMAVLLEPFVYWTTSPIAIH